MSTSSRGRRRKLYTLTEVSQLEDISMPTLQRYKKLYQERIPSVGEGRKQRYPSAALQVFRELKRENLAKRGRRKGSGKKKVVPAQRQPSEMDGLLTLSSICEETGISYPTLQRYVRLFGNRIPHRGVGRKRRYLPEAVAVFRQLRSESPRGGRRKGSGSKAGAMTDPVVVRRLARLERSNEELQRQIRVLTRLVKKPVSITLKR